MLLLLTKKTVALLVLIGPFSAIPIYLSTAQGLSAEAQKHFPQWLGIGVALAIILSGLLGVHLLRLLGLSMDGVRVAGGLITLMLAIAMVLGQEMVVKQGHMDGVAGSGRGLSPATFFCPLLFGPATIAYSMVHNQISSTADIVATVVPAAVCGLVTWFVFSTSHRAQRLLSPSSMAIVERLAGFLLAGLAVDMIATGLTGLFPALAGAPPPI